MKALIIGGNRFLGKALANELIRNGISVTTLNRGSLSPKYAGPVDHIKCDRNDIAAFQKAVNGKVFDVVYDMICTDPKVAADTAKSLEGVCGRLILASTSFVYPYGQHIHEEQFDPGNYSIPPDYLGLGSSELKRLTEAVYTQKTNLKVTLVRLPFVFGADDPSDKLKKIIKKIFFKEEIYIPNKSARFSVIAVEDAAKAMAKLGIYPSEGPINLASEIPVSMGQIIKIIEELSYRTASYTEKGDAKSISLFSLKTDWYIDTNRLKRLDFLAKPPIQWLPNLLEQIVNDVNKGL